MLKCASNLVHFICISVTIHCKMKLDLHKTIEVSTNRGKKYIELYVGDVTELPVHEKVDIVFVSAFPGLFELKLLLEKK